MRADDRRHGTKAGYEAGCRDLCCRRAQARYTNLWRMSGPRLVDVTGTRRRIEALQVLGWSMAELSRMLGHERTFCRKMLHNPSGKVQQKTSKQVAELYDRLSMTVPHDDPTRRRGWNASHARTRAQALAKGYAGPLCWDEDAIDDPRARPRGMAPTPRHRKPYRETAGHVATCPRCGVRRQVNESRDGGLCRDCKSVEKVA